VDGPSLVVRAGLTARPRPSGKHRGHRVVTGLLI
jgi:hypothetical protein